MKLEITNGVSKYPVSLAGTFSTVNGKINRFFGNLRTSPQTRKRLVPGWSDAHVRRLQLVAGRFTGNFLVPQYVIAFARFSELMLLAVALRSDEVVIDEVSDSGLS